MSKPAQAPIRITTAPVSRASELQARQRRYLASMTLRSACFVGAVIAALAGVSWLWPGLIAAAIVLPYVAVVAANAAAPLQDGFALPGPGAARELPPARR